MWGMKLTKTTVASVIFAVAEALPIKGLLSALLLSNEIKTANDSIFYVLVWTPALILAYVIGWLIFDKWNTKFWIKCVVAIGIILGSFYILGSLALSLMQRWYILNPPIS
jgi:hypothetical protein